MGDRANHGLPVTWLSRSRSLAETAAACSTQSDGCGQSDYGWPGPRFRGLDRAKAPANAHAQAVEYRYVVLGDKGTIALSAYM